MKIRDNTYTVVITAHDGLFLNNSYFYHCHELNPQIFPEFSYHETKVLNNFRSFKVILFFFPTIFLIYKQDGKDLLVEMFTPTFPMHFFPLVMYLCHLTYGVSHCLGFVGFTLTGNSTCSSLLGMSTS